MGGVVGLDLAGDEGGYGNAMYADCFKYAKEILLLNTTVHSGELGDEDAQLENVKIAINEMKVDRIGHGYAAAQDKEVMELIKHKVRRSSSRRTSPIKVVSNSLLRLSQGIFLEVCSGTALAERNLDAVKTLLANGVPFGLNEDDPSPYFGGCNYECVEAISRSCKGDGLKVSKEAQAICVLRRAIFKGGVGMNEDEIQRGYALSRKAGFKKM